jgi:hypothetical protein
MVTILASVVVFSLGVLALSAGVLLGRGAPRGRCGQDCDCTRRESGR